MKNDFEILKPHDSYFKALIAAGAFTPEVLKMIIPENVVELLDFGQLELADTSYLREDFTNAFSDAFLVIKLKNSPEKIGVWHSLRT